YTMAERARQHSPMDPFAADTLGWILYKRGEYSRALGLLLESASRLQNEPEVQFHVGLTHYMLGSVENARASLEYAVKANKDFIGKDEARRRLAILNTDVKTADATTLKNLEKSLESSPNDPVVLGLIAAIHERD